MGVGSHLGAQGFGHYQNVTNNGGIGNDELVGLANGGGHTSDGAPRVHNSLASKAQSLKPLIIRGTTTSRSFSVILVDTANNINMLSHSVTPMAYKSLRTFAQAILPCI